MAESRLRTRMQVRMPTPTARLIKRIERFKNSRPRDSSLTIALQGHSVDGFRLPRHVVHEKVLAQRIGCCEIGLATAHLRHLLHEVHQTIIGSQHKGVDQDASTFALRYFFQRLTHYQRVETEGVF